MGVQKTKQKKRTGSLYGILTRNSKSWRYNKERKKGLGWAAELWETSGNTQKKPRDGERYVRSLVPVALPPPSPATPPHLRMSSAWPPASTSNSAGAWGN